MLASVVILDSLAMLFMLFAVVRRSDSPGALPFFGLIAAVFLYNFGYGMELMTPPGLMSYFWNHFQYWGIATLPGFWLWLSLETPLQAKLRSHWLLAAIFVVPVLTLVFNLTNDWHHWYYTSLDYVQEGSITVAHIVKGPWYLVHILYSMAIFVLSLVFFWVRWRKLENGYGGMAVGLLVGSVFYWGGAILYQFGWVPENLDVTPIGLTISVLTYYLVLWPARMFEIIPLSREMVFRLIPEPVLVADRNSRLVDWNPASIGLFPELSRAQAGWPLERVIPERSWLETLRDPQFASPVTLARNLELPAWFTIVPTLVRQTSGRVQGRVFLFRDVTDQVAKDNLLAKLDMTDPVTGLFKEEPFKERAAALVLHRTKRTEPVSLILLELPDLKKLRETHREAVLQSWLKVVVSVWSPLIHNHDLFARLEADRFAVLLPGTPAPKALSLAESLCTRLKSRTFAAQGGDVRLAARFGVAGIQKTETARFDNLWTRALAALEITLEKCLDRAVVGCLANEDGLVNTCLEEEGDV